LASRRGSRALVLRRRRPGRENQEKERQPRRAHESPSSTLMKSPFSKNDYGWSNSFRFEF